MCLCRELAGWTPRVKAIDLLARRNGWSVRICLSVDGGCKVNETRTEKRFGKVKFQLQNDSWKRFSFSAVPPIVIALVFWVEREEISQSPLARGIVFWSVVVALVASSFLNNLKLGPVWVVPQTMLALMLRTGVAFGGVAFVTFWAKPVPETYYYAIAAVFGAGVFADLIARLIFPVR